MSAPEDPRIDALLEVLLAYARQDFSARAKISDARDSVDAIAAGLNMLAEELHGAVASRRELEQAYASMKEAQARLIHGGKLVAIGQLASGVAHEINNPASWLLGSLGLLTRDLEQVRGAWSAASSTPEEQRARTLKFFDELSTWLRDASDGMERIVAVTRDLRTYSRADSDDTEVVSISEVVRAACSLARPLLQREARVELQLEDCATVIGNRGRLGQVVTNLLVNAAHAVSGSKHPDRRINVEARVREGWALLAVEDSGAGVPVELRQRVFEPFFSTKGEEGTGLGLSLVAEIVHRHGGQVRVEDSALGGARFEVLLPHTRAERVLPLPTMDTKLPHRPRLLLIDDEPRLLQTYAALLQDAADVKLASDGLEALALLNVDRAFDVILCDLQMPELDGPGFYTRLQALAPELAGRTLFTSGGVFRQSVREFLAVSPVPVLEKPVREQVLLEMLARAVAKNG